MEILAYIWFGGLVLFILVVSMDGYVQKNFSETHPFKKFWKNHIIDMDPEEKKYKNDRRS
jgi:hypothetical protein